MSVLRPVRSAQFFDIFEVDTFVLMQAVSITSVTHPAFNTLQVNLSDPNSGADQFDYTYHLYRSVDGSPMVPAVYVPGVVEPFLSDNFYLVSTSAVGTMPDGTVVTLPPVAYMTSAAVIAVITLTSPTPLVMLLDTTVTTPLGTLVVPAGTTVVMNTGTSISQIAVPHGHTYSYEVQAQNKYATTAVSAASSITVASSFTAQTLNSLSRSNNVISLTWTDPNSYSTGQQIEVWKEVGASGFDLLATITKSSGAMPTAFNDAFAFFTLIPATYSYKIRPVSISPQDTGAFSNVQSIVVSFTLSAVTALTPTIISGGINLTWTDPNSPSAEGGLYVYRDAGNTGVFTLIGGVAPGVAVYADLFQTIPGQIYSYQVAAWNSLHVGPASTTASITTALAAPVISSVVQAADVGAVITWSDTNQFETAYTLQRAINGGSFATVSSTIPAGSTSYRDSFSQPIGTFIAYQVKATNATATSAYSTPVQIVLNPQLVAPGNLSVVIAQQDEIVVKWKNISPLVRGTSVYRSVNGAALTLEATVAASVSEFDDEFITVSGAVYVYAVQNFDNQETGPQSPPVAVTTPFDPPQNLKVIGTSGNNANISWSTNNAAMDYTSVEIAFADSQTFTEVARVPPGQTTATIVITGGTPGEAVLIRVREIKQPYTILGNVQVPQNLGLYSLTVSTTTALLAPTSVLVVRPNPVQNRITWNDANTLATGFQVWRSLSSAGPVYSAPVMVGNIQDPTVRSFLDTFPMGPGLTVQYWVYAIGTSNTSPQSNVATFTSRIGQGSTTTVQTARAQITLTMTPPPGYSFVSGDQVQISRSINGSTMSVINTVTAFASPTQYVDSALTSPNNTDDQIGYSIRFFSSTEAGPDSLTTTQILYDAVFMPLGAVNTVKVFGSRNGFTVAGQGVFAGCANGLVKITNNPTTFEPVLLTSSSDYTGSMSVASGDLTRIVAAAETSEMFLIDATTLTRVTSPVTTAGWFGVSNNSGSFQVNLVGQSANFSGASTGIYKGWAFAGPLSTSTGGVAPWDSTASSFVDVFGSPVVGGSDQPFIALPGGTPQPQRLEVIGGDAVVFLLQTTNSGFTSTYNTTMYQVQRSTNQALEVFNIANYVVDIVSDGVTKVLAVTIAGDIYVVDTSLVPSSANAGFLGFNPFPIGAVIGNIPLPSVFVQPPPGEPAFGHPGDMITIGTGSISIELGAGQRVATAVHNGGATTVHVFSVPSAPITVNTTLTVLKTYVVNERINGLAFDGGKFFYGRSVDTSKLFRFDAGL